MTDPAAAILNRLDQWDRDHDTSGCPGGPACIHTAAAVLRDLVVSRPDTIPVIAQHLLPGVSR